MSFLRMIRMVKWIQIRVIMTLLLISVGSLCLAQKKDRQVLQDTLNTEKKPPKVKVRKPQQERLNPPSRAAIFSAILPGAGQAYNKKFWKIPIIYAGLTLGGLYIREYNNEYIEAKTNLSYLNDDNPYNDSPLTNPDIDERFFGVDSEGFRRRRDRFRRERDYTFLLTLIWFGLNVADAAVDAHMREFDVSDDLSVQIKPSSTQFFNQNVMGVSVCFNFTSAVTP